MNEKRVLKFRTVNEWSNKTTRSNTTPQRKLANICVIDDDGIDEERLRKQGYTQISRITQLSHITEVEPYNVILCDIKGVGLDLDSTKQGVALALDLKKMYPEKLIIQYSGQNPLEYDSNYPENKMLLDGFIKKGCSTKDLVDQLDEKCAIIWDPVKAWKFAEKIMRNNNVANKVIAYIENLYVKSLEDKEDYLLKKKINKKIVIDCIKGIIKFLSTVISIVIGL